MGHFVIVAERVTGAGANWPVLDAMPPGLERHLSEQEYRDALATLQLDGEAFFRKTCCLGCGLYQGIVAGCLVGGLKSQREAVLRPWTDKGVSVEIVGGTKYQGPRLRVSTPADGTPTVGSGRITHV